MRSASSKSFTPRLRRVSWLSMCVSMKTSGWAGAILFLHSWELHRSFMLRWQEQWQDQHPRSLNPPITIRNFYSWGTDWVLLLANSDRPATCVRKLLKWTGLSRNQMKQRLSWRSLRDNPKLWGQTFVILTTMTAAFYSLALQIQSRSSYWFEFDWILEETSSLILHAGQNCQVHLRICSNAPLRSSTTY